MGKEVIAEMGQSVEVLRSESEEFRFSLTILTQGGI